jgi:hypothetical protein
MHVQRYVHIVGWSLAAYQASIAVPLENTKPLLLGRRVLERARPGGLNPMEPSRAGPSNWCWPELVGQSSLGDGSLDQSMAAHGEEYIQTSVVVDHEARLAEIPVETRHAFRMNDGCLPQLVPW